MFPHERSLVKRLKDEPFAIIGVNSDSDLTMLHEKIQEENITWRSFWNGEKGTSGPISTRWNIQGWPSLFLLDAKGVIRHKWLGNPGDEVIDEAIDKLVAEAMAGQPQ